MVGESFRLGLVAALDLRVRERLEPRQRPPAVLPAEV